MDTTDTDTLKPPKSGGLAPQNRTEGAARPAAESRGLNARQRAVLQEAPSSARGILERAYSGKSKAAALKAFCLRCVGYVREDVRDCTSYDCPLWPYRPYQQDAEADDAE